MPRTLTIAREHLQPGGVYDHNGVELTFAHSILHLTELFEALPHRVHVAIAEAHRVAPDDTSHRAHQDAADEFNLHVHGRWHVDRFDAPIEYYAALVHLGKGYGQTVSEQELAAMPAFHTLTPAERVAADALLKKNHRPDSADFEDPENLFTTQGVAALWNQAANNGTANTGAASPGVRAWYNNGQAVIGVGDSSAAAANTQFDLQAATNRLWVAMDATFPTLPGTGSNAIVFRATFGTSQANYSWQEFGVADDNGSNVTIPGSAARSASNGSLLDRVTSNQGTKASGQTWQPSMTLTIS